MSENEEENVTLENVLAWTIRDVDGHGCWCACRDGEAADTYHTIACRRMRAWILWHPWGSEALASPTPADVERVARALERLIAGSVEFVAPRRQSLHGSAICKCCNAPWNGEHGRDCPVIEARAALAAMGGLSSA